MKYQAYAIFYFLFISKHVAFAERIGLPGIFTQKAVSHVRVKQLPGYCCGYNTLFNACNLEHLFGIVNPHNVASKFDALCRPFISSRGKVPMDGATNRDLEELAKKLGLTGYHFMNIDPTFGVVPYGALSVEIYHDPKMVQAEKDKLLLGAKKKKIAATIDGIKQELAQATKTCMVHFGCHVHVTEPHCILMTLVQFADKTRALFVCDNVNREITDDSMAKKHLDYLSQTFDVSPKKNLIAQLDVPSVWPSLNDRPVTA